MKVIENSKLIESLNWRYATKKFNPSKKISNVDWKTLEDALVLTPSSYGLQPWKFMIITNQDIKNKLVDCSWGQKQPAECSHMIVMTVLKTINEAYIDKFLDRQLEIRGGEKENLEGFKKMLMGSIVNGPISKKIPEWGKNQAYIALGNLMTIASLLGIDACPMEGINLAKYDETLKLIDTNYTTVVACPVGYRADDDKYAGSKKIRFKNQDVVQYI